MHVSKVLFRAYVLVHKQLRRLISRILTVDIKELHLTNIDWPLDLTLLGWQWAVPGDCKVYCAVMTDVAVTMDVAVTTDVAVATDIAARADCYKPF